MSSNLFGESKECRSEVFYGYTAWIGGAVEF